MRGDRKNLAWSWSRLQDFETCPLMCYWKNVAPKWERCPKPSGPALVRGREVHDTLEKALHGEVLPPELNHVAPIVNAICEARNAGWAVATEQQVAFREDLSRCGWFDKDVWVRVIYDVVMRYKDRMRIIDWKTGKSNPPDGQLRLFGLTGFALCPDVNDIETSYIMTDQRRSVGAKYSREHIDQLEQEFRDRSEFIQVAYNTPGEWEAKPTDWKCKYCPCTKRQCKHAVNP